MCTTVLAIEDANDDSEEPGQFGHTLRIRRFRIRNNCLTDLGFSRRERERHFEFVKILAREAGGCKPVLASPARGPLSV